MPFKSTLTRLRPPSGSPTVLLVQSVTYASGEGVFIAGSAAFFTRYVGISATRVGAVLSIAAAVALLAKVPLGRAADRYGGRLTWFVAALAQVALYCMYPLVRGFTTATAVATAVAVASALGAAARGKILGDLISPRNRVQVQAYIRALTNLGYAIGTALAAIALTVDTAAGYASLALVNAASYVVDCVLISRLPPPSEASRRKAAKGELAASSVLRDWPFMLLGLVNSMIFIGNTLLSIVMPLWILTRTHAPRSMVAILLLLNIVAAVALQTSTARGCDSIEGSARTQRRAAAYFAACCAAFAFSWYTSGFATIVLLVIAVITLTGGELLGSAGGWGLSYELAPAERRGEYLVVFGLGGDLVKLVGPLALTALTIGEPGWGWYLVLAVFLGLGAAARPCARWAARTERVGTRHAMTESSNTPTPSGAEE